MKPLSQIYVVVLSCFAASCAVCKNGNVDADLTIIVRDDKGNAVSNALVRGTFEAYGYTDYFGPKYKGLTDTNGVFMASGHGFGPVTVRVEKSGYYSTFVKHRLGDYTQAKKQGQWTKVNLNCKVTLKKRRNPIPMYAKRVDTLVPKLDEPVGYDLLEGDWVKPYGKGKICDFTVTVSGNIKSFNDRHVWGDIQFASQYDGVQTCRIIPLKSDLRSMHVAPDDGYARSYKYEKKINENRDEWINAYTREDEYLVFRSRSVIDEDGNLVQANYGKIYNDFVCDFEDKDNIGLYFIYFFNPTPNDRNIEFAPKQNLFPRSKDTNIPVP
jgi:hypothetical protein